MSYSSVWGHQAFHEHLSDLSKQYLSGEGASGWTGQTSPSSISYAPPPPRADSPWLSWRPAEPSQTTPAVGTGTEWWSRPQTPRRRRSWIRRPACWFRCLAVSWSTRQVLGSREEDKHGTHGSLQIAPGQEQETFRPDAAGWRWASGGFGTSLCSRCGCTHQWQRRHHSSFATRCYSIMKGDVNFHRNPRSSFLLDAAVSFSSKRELSSASLLLTLTVVNSGRAVAPTAAK